MSEKKDVLGRARLALMVLKTLHTLGPLHGYGIARADRGKPAAILLAVNYGTLYPALLKLEQEGYISSEMGCFGQQPESEILQTDGAPARSNWNAKTRRVGAGRRQSWPGFLAPGERSSVKCVLPIALG